MFLIYNISNIFYIMMYFDILFCKFVYILFSVGNSWMVGFDL